MPHNKTLIIGRGLAGGVLSLRLHERHIAHDMIDKPTLSHSSRVAGGIINPVVLKRLVLVKNAGRYLPAAHSFYTKWSEKWPSPYYQSIPIHHIFQSTGEVNKWMEKAADPPYSNYLGKVFHSTTLHLPAPHGMGSLAQSAWLNTPRFLDWHASYHAENGELLQIEVKANELSELSKKYERVILCTGQLERFLNPGLEKAFAPTRGEVMVIQTDQLPQDAIYHGPVFILPLGDHQFKIGATYHWDDLHDKASADGLEQLTSRLEKIYTGPYKIIEQKAGVRPNTRDRQPLIGHLRDNIFVFNGLGSRAVLMAPYLSHLFTEYLFNGGSLPESCDLKRFL